MTSRILVVHASFHGQTRAIAERIAEKIVALGHRVEIRAAGAAAGLDDIDSFDGVIVGGAVQRGRYMRPLEHLIAANAKRLAARQNAFFSVSMSAAHKTDAGLAEARKHVAGLETRTGWTPQDVALIAGALKYTRYGFVLRFVMRMISRAAGGDTDTSRDHEYTDWQAVDRFALSFAGRFEPHLVAAE
jgi:menaquinone-dependent protoporphyrinogen oxidase